MGYLKSFFKRLTSVALTALIVVGMTAGIAAKSFDDVDKNDNYREQIDILSDIGIIVGTSETEFSPDENVTREQMAMFLFRTMLGRNNAGTTNTTNFKDLYDVTYNGAISWANAAGYIIGTSADTFEPTGGIKLQDAMTMLVRALGQSTKEMDSGYPWTYIDAAVKLGLDNDLGNLSYEKTLTRAETAALIYNALTAECLVSKTASNGTPYIVKTTIIEYVFGYELDSGVVSATNNYSIDGKELVVKNDYVTIQLEDRSMTVSFDELGLAGKADEWLGKNLMVMYKVDSKTRLVTVLGATYSGSSKTYDTLAITDSGKSITIDGVKYNIVETLSDKLATNANELLFYVYANDGKLTQLTNNEAVKNYLGIYNVELMFDSGLGVANRAILKNYVIGRLSISEDKINIANNLKAGELTGGFDNEPEAVSGDYVLYYFNKGNKSLEIKEVLTANESKLITKMTASTVTIGDTTYTIGNAAAGADPAAIKAKLAVGQNISVITKNGYILAIADKTTTVDSKYLIILDNVIPVYTDNTVRYVTRANIDGITTNIITNNPSVTAGAVYRYTVNANDIYTLIPANTLGFTQNDDIASIFNASAKFEISRGGLPYYTLNGVNFVTDADTVILVKNNGIISITKGAYASTLTIDNDAQVTAIYRNNIGSVETLRFLYISNGSIGTVESSAQYVKILGYTGSEYVSGTVYHVYSVYNYYTAEKETRMSIDNNLAIGSACAIDYNGHIVNTAPATLVKGILNGYSGATITVNGSIYKLAADVKINTLNSNNTLTAKTIAEINQTAVEFVIVGGEVKSILSTTSAVAAVYSSDLKAVVFTPTFSIEGITGANAKVLSVANNGNLVENSGWEFKVATVNGATALKIPLYWIDAGNYTFTFTIYGTTYTAQATLPAIAPTV